MLNSLSRVQLETLTLWYLVQHSLSSFYKISQHYSSLTTAIQPDQVPTWQALGIHANHVQRLKDFASRITTEISALSGKSSAR